MVTLTVEKMEIAGLSADPGNVRRHSVRNLEAITASLRRFGQQKPIVVDAHNVVRAGNGTLEAARKLGWKEIAVVRTALAGADAVAYAIADNRTAELARWDTDSLSGQLAAMDEELRAVAGFVEGELASLLGEVENGKQETVEKELAVPEIYELAVVCRDEADQKALFNRLSAEGRQCRVLTL